MKQVPLTLDEILSSRINNLGGKLLKSIKWTSDCTIKIYKVRWLYVKQNYNSLVVLTPAEAKMWLSL